MSSTAPLNAPAPSRSGAACDSQLVGEQTSGLGKPPSVVLVNPDAVSTAARLQSRFPLDRIVKYFDFGQFIKASRVGAERAVDDEEVSRASRLR